MVDTRLGIRLLRVLDTAPEGRLTPRETVRRLAMDYAPDYFAHTSLLHVRQILQSEDEAWQAFFQRVCDVRMDLAYRGLVGFLSPRGPHEGRWFITQHGHDWLSAVWTDDVAMDITLHLPPRRADWREQPAASFTGATRGEKRTIDLDALDPRDLETIMGDLLRRLGWRPTVTRYSQDGGIDIDAVNPAPIVGGRVLVQCKRRRGTIGVAAVRELYGVVVAEQATKGVLVTTGVFSKAAILFAENRPLDLIDRPRLLAIFRQNGYPTTEGAPDTAPSASR